VSIVFPKPGKEAVPQPPYTSGADGDFGPVIDQIIAWVDSHEFMGAAIPHYTVEFGPDHFSSLLGCEMLLHQGSSETRWAVPFVDDWDNAEIRFRRDCEWWKRTVAFVRALRKRCDGKVLISAPTFVAGLDCLAAIRGVEPLLVDLVERPEKVKRALDDAFVAYEEIMEAFSKELNYAEFGSANRHGMYSTGRINIPQCDFSCMISPQMFDEFQIPFLKKESELLDATEYHLDGPDAIKHLESLCAVKGLDIIQWVCGAGEAQEQNWWELYRRIDSLGKGQILGGNHERIKTIWNELSSRKLFFVTGASSREEAEAFLAEMEMSAK